NGATVAARGVGVAVVAAAPNPGRSTGHGLRWCVRPEPTEEGGAADESAEAVPEALTPAGVTQLPVPRRLGLGVGRAADPGHGPDDVLAEQRSYQPRRYVAWFRCAHRGGQVRQPF